MNYSWFWRDELWFPMKKGVLTCGWKDLENIPGSNVYYPQTSDLHWSLIIGFILIIFRFVTNKLVVEPLGYKLGVRRCKTLTVEDNPVLEKMYLQKTKLNSHLIQKMAKQTDMKERQIQIWFRRRKSLDAPQAILKFTDCSWHFTFYGLAFLYGVKVLWNKPWSWETKKCWYDWPTQSVDEDIYWYYMIELGFYWSLIFTLFTDHKRKDFIEMIVHHIATIILMYFSWMMNFVRIGSLVLVTHDAADPWLALAKMCNYCKFSLGKEIGFVIFLIVWILSRLWFYPFIVLYSSTMDPYYTGLIDTTFFTHWFFNFFLYLLMVLHLLWSYSICKIIINKFKAGDIQDVRSDSEDDSSVDYDDNDNSFINDNTVINGNCATKIK